MKQQILPSLRLTLVCVFVFAIAYTLLILGVAQAAPNKGNGQTLSVNNKVVGYALEGQSFTADKYFNGRPSAVGYNAAGSGGSNKGPSNPEYLQQVKDRLDTFLIHNPAIKKEQIPAELLTASGSGLDPDISYTAAMVQVARIAATRKINEENIIALVKEKTQQPLLHLFGTQKINVLQLNIALDEMK